MKTAIAMREDKMAIEYIDRAEYCEKHCRCSNEYCDRQSCPIWKAPAADVAPVVHGVWVPVYESEITGWDPALAGCDPIGGYICSKCHYEAVYDCNDKYVLSDYCPGCGAKMDGGEDAEG